MQEYKAPFQPGSKITKAGLHLVSIESEITRCPYHEKWMKERGNAREHARFYINDFRVWSNHSIYAGKILPFLIKAPPPVVPLITPSCKTFFLSRS